MRVLDLSQPEEPSPSLPHPYSFQQPASPPLMNGESLNVPGVFLSHSSAHLPPPSSLLKEGVEAERIQGQRSGNPREGLGGRLRQGQKGQPCLPVPLEKVTWPMTRNSEACPMPVGWNTQIFPLGNDHALRYFDILKQKELWDPHFVWIRRVTTELYLTTLLMLAHFPILEMHLECLKSKQDIQNRGMSANTLWTEDATKIFVGQIYAEVNECLIFIFIHDMKTWD